MTTYLHGRARCRECGKASGNPEVVREDADGTWIRCRHCGQVVLRMTADEMAEVKRQQNKEYQRKYSVTHAEQNSARYKRYHEAHRDERNARMRAYREAHREEFRLYSKKYQLMKLRAEKAQP